MERFHRAKRAFSLTAVAAVPVVLGASGCGGEDDYANKPRPPAPITIGATVSENRISVSPESFGAGPVTLIVTNQTERAQELTLETDEIGGSAPGIEQRTGPINPGDTASVKADLRRGTYRVGVESTAIEAAKLSVGAARKSAQDDLLQP